VALAHLEGAGYTVLAAASGEEALDVLASGALRPGQAPICHQTFLRAVSARLNARCRRCVRAIRRARTDARRSKAAPSVRSRRRSTCGTGRARSRHSPSAQRSKAEIAELAPRTGSAGCASSISGAAAHAAAQSPNGTKPKSTKFLVVIGSPYFVSPAGKRVREAVKGFPSMSQKLELPPQVMPRSMCVHPGSTRLFTQQAGRLSHWRCA
jgi:CheY-like chemotaxis protein